jgi:Glycosyltransferase family 87
MSDFDIHGLWRPRGIRPWLWLGAGELVAVGMVLAPDARRSLPIFLALFAASSLVALLAARSLSASGPAFLLLCGGALRLTLLCRAPDLSDDIHRYIFDARIAAAGLSPYAAAPRDPAVRAVAPDLLPRVAHGELKTVYPPVAEAAFRAAGWIGPGVVPMKALFAAADLAVVPLVLALGGPQAGYAAALYAFHPLAVTESAGQGHVDSLGVALLLASLVLLDRRRSAASGALFALSALTKYVPLAATAPLARRGRWAFAGASILTGVAVWAAASRPGASPASGLPAYANRWEFNSLLYPAAVSLIDRAEAPARAKSAFLDLKERLGHPPWTRRVFPYFYSGFFARAALAVVLAAALATIGWRVRRTETAVFASLAVALLVSPTLHPWYLLWLLPFAARRREPAFLYLSFAIPLSYALLYPVAGLPPRLIAGVEYVPFLALLCFARRAEPSPVAGEPAAARA